MSLITIASVLLAIEKAGFPEVLDPLRKSWSTWPPHGFVTADIENVGQLELSYETSAVLDHNKIKIGTWNGLHMRLFFTEGANDRLLISHFIPYSLHHVNSWLEIYVFTRLRAARTEKESRT